MPSLEVEAERAAGETLPRRVVDVRNAEHTERKTKRECKECQAVSKAEKSW